MKQYEFKSNLRCENCVKTVQEAIGKEDSLELVSIDLSSSDKQIIIRDNNDQGPQFVMDIIKKAGFEAKLKKKGLFGLFN